MGQKICYRWKEEDFVYDSIDYAFNYSDDESDSYLIPANCTYLEPPKTEGIYVPVWNVEKNRWDVKADHRRHLSPESGTYEGGTPYWLPGDKWDTPAHYMTELGDLPQNAMLEPPAEPTEAEKFMDEIKDKTEADIRKLIYETKKYRFLNDEIKYGESQIPMCQFGNEAYTIDEAKSRYLNYLGDDDEKAQDALRQSSEAKEYVRQVVAKYVPINN